MFSREFRRTTRNGKARRLPARGGLERLEGRELLAYSSLGISLPDLSVSGYSAPVASWGSNLNVTIDVRNTGASTLPDPAATFPAGQASTADAPSTQVAVFATKRAHNYKGEVLVGMIEVPALPQNTLQQITSTISLPNRPAGFPGDGGRIYLHFVINPDGAILEADPSNNTSQSTAVKIQAPFPELQATGLSVPAVIQPGDTISPAITVANYGPADSGTQGPVNVILVASVDRTFGPGSSIIASYQVDNIAALSTAPTQSTAVNPATIDPPNNVVTILGAPVTVPTSPKVYYIGVVVDPNNQIKQLHNVASSRFPYKKFVQIVRVGPPIKDLSPAGVVRAGGGVNNPPFPFPLS